MNVADVLFDTLGSEETGEALKALPRIANSLERIAHLLDLIISDEEYGCYLMTDSRVSGIIGTFEDTEE